MTKSFIYIYIDLDLMTHEASNLIFNALPTCLRYYKMIHMIYRCNDVIEHDKFWMLK